MASSNPKLIEDDDENSFFSADEGDDEIEEQNLLKSDENPTRHINAVVKKPVCEPQSKIQPPSSVSLNKENFTSTEIAKNDSEEEVEDWNSYNWASTFEKPSANNKNEAGQLKKVNSDQKTKSKQSDERKIESKHKRSSELIMKEGKHDQILLGHHNAQHQQQNSWFGGWNTIISAASDSINTLTSTVGEGLTTVLETMESGLGAPTPEELARMSLEEKRELNKKADEVKEPLPANEPDDCDSAEEIFSEGGSDSNATGRSDRDDLSSGYQSDSVLLAKSHHDHHPSSSLSSGLLSNVSHLIGTTGRTLVTGSLDVMENIGKRTFDVLTEPVTSSTAENYSNPTDPAHQRRKLRFQAEKPDLSAVLREAKSKNEKSIGGKFTLKPSSNDSATREEIKPTFDGFFEQHTGTVSLDALQILADSQQAQLESILKSLSRERRTILSKSIDQSKEQFEEILSEESEQSLDSLEFESIFLEIWDAIDIYAFKCNRLLDVYGKFFKYAEKLASEELQPVNTEDLFGHCVEFFGEFAACVIEMFLKLCQLMIVEKQSPDYANFAKLAKLILNEVQNAAFKTSILLKVCADNEECGKNVSSVVADLFLEAHNTSTCLQDASRLLLPIFNVLFVEFRLK